MEVLNMPGLDELEAIKTSGLDLSGYEGTKASIEKVEVEEVPTPYDEDGNLIPGLQRKIKCLRVSTGVVATVKTTDGDKDLVASELFNLKEENGKLGWSNNKKGKLNKFLAKMDVLHPKDLKGKNVILRIRKKVGSENEFLGFYID